MISCGPKLLFSWKWISKGSWQTGKGHKHTSSLFQNQTLFHKHVWKWKQIWLLLHGSKLIWFLVDIQMEINSTGRAYTIPLIQERTFSLPGEVCKVLFSNKTTFRTTGSLNEITLFLYQIYIALQESHKSCKPRNHSLVSCVTLGSWSAHAEKKFLEDHHSHQTLIQGKPRSKHYLCIWHGSLYLFNNKTHLHLQGSSFSTGSASLLLHYHLLAILHYPSDLLSCTCMYVCVCHLAFRWSCHHQPLPTTTSICLHLN